MRLLKIYKDGIKTHSNYIYHIYFNKENLKIVFLVVVFEINKLYIFKVYQILIYILLYEH